MRNLGGGEAHVEVDHQGDARVGGGADRQGPDPIKPLTLFFTLSKRNMLISSKLSNFESIELHTK